MATENARPGAGVDPLRPTQMVTTTTTVGASPVAEVPLYPPEGPQPAGTEPGVTADPTAGADTSAATGIGIEGEDVVWEARYSMKNFVGRLVVRTVLTIAWFILAVYTWGEGHRNWTIPTVAAGVILGGFWVALAYRIAQARFGHFYRLTNRRLFVSTGLMRRPRDQMELLRVKDVFTRQTLVERWLSLGSVVVVSTEKELPTFYLSGVDDPKQVMDLVWHHARAERDQRSTNIHTV